MTTKTVDMSEKAFQASVLDLAERLNWKTAHFHDSRRQVRGRDGKPRTIGDSAAAGFPDVVFVRRDRLIFAELKREKGRLLPSQVDWLADLERTEAEVYLWRPADWSQVESVLR
jgi:VRR-NUC domain-containing protein